VFDHKQWLLISAAAARVGAVSVLFLGSMLSTPVLAVPIGGELTGTSQPDYVFGVFPYLPPRELEQIYAPVAVEFSRVLGRNVRFTSSTSYEIFAGRIDSEELDIAFMQPFDYVRAADQHHYLPLAARGEPLKALIVTAPDSPVKTLEDLRGKRLSLPPMDSAVSHLVRVYLSKNGLVPDKDVTLVYHRSHVSCMQQVMIEASAACGTALPGIRYFKVRMKVDMRVILETDAIPHTLFAVNSRVPTQERALLLKDITSWASTPEGKAILERGKLVPFNPINDDAYNVVRKFPHE
jgi:phosphonate transport system substrate-binding protein